MKSRRVFMLLAGVASLVVVLVTATLTVNAQGLIPIKYGDTVKGEVKSTGTDYAVFYTFTAKAGDTVTITMTRTSGNLRPLIVLADPSKTGDAFVVAQSDISDDGKTATITEAAIGKAGKYAVVATRESYSKGTTTGKYTLTFDRGAGDTPTDTPVPTKKGGATPTKKPVSKATATPVPTAEVTDEPTTEPDTATDTPVPTKKPNATPTKKPITKTTPTPVPTEESTPGTTAGVDVFTVGTSPSYSVWSGNNLYVANMGDGSVSILDGDGNATGTIKVGGVPFALAWDGARLWVADYGTTDKPGNTVSVFDAKGKKIGTYKVGTQPFSMSYDIADSQMWIALYGDNKIVSLDPKGKVVNTVDVSEAGHNPNTVLWAGTQLFATLSGTQDNVGNTVIAVGSDGSITGTFNVGKNPADLAWDDADQTLFVANYDDGTVTALDAEGNTIGTYKVGKNPGALAWDGEHLWVSLSGENAAAALDNKGKVLAKVALDNAPNGITSDGAGHVWVALQGTNDKPGNEIARINTATALGQ